MTLKINKIMPLFTSLITTMNKYEDDVKIGSIVDGSKAKGTLKEYQKVIAVGPSVREIKEGDWVMINPQRFATVNHKHKPNSLAQDVQKDTTTITYSFDVVNMNGEDYLLLQDRDIMYVFEGEEIEETEEKSSPLIIPDSNLII